jgi:hypothetical protein
MDRRPPGRPSTRRRVEALIEHAGRDPQESLGLVPPKGGPATVEKLAVNAVMGGCQPEHFPVVLAAVEALLDPAHNLNGVSQTTHMCVSLVIVGGPVAKELGFNSRDGVFGNGYRPNAAVGRAVRLALWNLGGPRCGRRTRRPSPTAENPWPGEWGSYGCEPPRADLTS